MVSEIFDPQRWQPVEGFEGQDLTYHRAVDQGTVRIAFNRPGVLMKTFCTLCGST